MNFIPLKPIPIKNRMSFVFIEKGKIDVIDGAFVVVDKAGVRTQIPVGSVTCIMLEPGTRLSHSAAKLAAVVGTLLIWVGEAGVRVYASGQPGGSNAAHLLYQAKLALDDNLRLKIVRKMYEYRFDNAPKNRSIDQLRGLEGARVKGMYKLLAKKYNVEWKGRRYNPKDWGSSDTINRCISAATSCLYGVTEAAILAAGYSPAIGFLHSGKPLSFVYDIADLIKFETVVPVAFEVASKQINEPDRLVRVKCREAFREKKTLAILIPLIEEILKAGGLNKPSPPTESVPPAIPLDLGIGDVGHQR